MTSIVPIKLCTSSYKNKLLTPLFYPEKYITLLSEAY